MAKKRPPRFHGLLAIDKPAGPTSHDVVAWVRWVLNERAVGHCGTLDPAATGVLLVCVGAATRLSGLLTLEDKGYAARFCLGVSTTTADAAGEVLDRVELSADLANRAATELEGMIGPLSLPPPAYSALRVDGVRAHELARKGAEVRLEHREMIIREARELALVAGAPTGQAWLDAELLVSKGSYIRSIAEELGRRLQVPAHLDSLRRTSSGRVSLDLPDLIAPGARREGERWRIGAGLGAASREEMRELVVPKLLDPLEFLTSPVRLVADGEASRNALRRLGHGQKLGLHSPEGDAILAAPWATSSTKGPLERFFVRGEAGPDGVVVLVELEQREGQGERGPCLAPLRVLRLPRAGPAAQSTDGS
jgi:tRNA pseudouridine55 synthase